MRWVALLAVLYSGHIGYAQSYVTIIIDAKHLAIVNENGAVRLASEIAHNNMLDNIRSRIDDINVNLSSVVLVQRVIHRSLAEVNGALKTGRSALHVARLVHEIAVYTGRMLDAAKGEPWLMLFAEGAARQLKNRGIGLATEVSGFILKEGSNVLMDYGKRDALMRKVILELKVIRALVYSMERSMYWAKAHGLVRMANPYSGFINMDKRKAEEIIRNYRLLKN